MPEKQIKIEVRRREAKDGAVQTVKYGDPIHISFINAPIASKVEIINTVNNTYHWAYIGGTGGFDFVIPWFWGKEADRYVNYEVRYPDRSCFIELIRDPTPKIYFSSSYGVVLTGCKDYFNISYFNSNSFDRILISPTGREINLGKDQWAAGRPGQFGGQEPQISVQESEKGGTWKAVLRDDSGKNVSNIAEMFYFSTDLCSVRFDKEKYQVGDKMKIYCENAGPNYLLTIFERWDRGNKIEGHILTKTNQVFEHIITHNFDYAVEIVYEPYYEYAVAVCEVGHGWTKQDFVNALQDKGPIPLEDYPPGGWLRGWSRTEPYMLEYQKGNLRLGIDLEAPRCKDNPPTGIDCVRWDTPDDYCPFTKDTCDLWRNDVEDVQEAIRKLYGESEYLACMVIRPESSRYVTIGDTVYLKLTVSNCGTEKCKIKGAIKIAGKIFIEEEKLMDVNEKITISKELSIVDFVSIGFYAYHQENGDWTLDEYEEVSLELHPTQKPTKGSVDIAKSTIPEEIYLTKPSTFRIHIENTSGKATRYRTTLAFTGIDVSKEYTFTSGWSEMISPNESIKLDVEVTLPEDAIPPDKDEAVYEVKTILEANI